MDNLKTVFLDRDDTICKDVPYCSRPEDLLRVEGSGDALSRLKKSGFMLILITNQSGVSRGFFSESQLVEIHNKLQTDLSKYNVRLDDIFYCPCLPSEGCLDRKPGIGLFHKAEKKYAIDKDNSYMIGDKEKDIKAGKNYGVKTILVTNENERGNEDYFAENITKAVDWIIKNER